MPTQGKGTIARQSSAANLAINNTLSDKELQGLVATYGYTNEKMQAGKKIYTSAAEAVKAQKVAVGTQRQATLDARVAEQTARANYRALAQVARALFVDNASARATLGLSGPTPDAAVEFIAAANQLFDNALNVPTISAALGEYGYDAKRLTREQATIAAFDVANQDQAAAKGAAQQATRDQNAALAALNKWLAQYLKIAKVALRDRPQLYEKLGGVARSSRTAAQRQAPKKAAATRAAKKTGEVATLTEA